MFLLKINWNEATTQSIWMQENRSCETRQREVWTQRFHLINCWKCLRTVQLCDSFSLPSSLFSESSTRLEFVLTHTASRRSCIPHTSALQHCAHRFTGTTFIYIYKYVSHPAEPHRSHEVTVLTSGCAAAQVSGNSNCELCSVTHSNSTATCIIIIWIITSAHNALGIKG